MAGLVNRARLDSKKADDLRKILGQNKGEVTLRDLQRRHGIDRRGAESFVRDFPEMFVMETSKPKTGRPSQVMRSVGRG
jgi:hypothetical protein